MDVRASGLRLRGESIADESAPTGPGGSDEGAGLSAQHPRRFAISAMQVLRGYFGRTVLNEALTSETNSSGCSHAAKWPPLGSVLKWMSFGNAFTAQLRGAA